MLQMQRRVAEIDALAFGPDGASDNAPADAADAADAGLAPRATHAHAHLVALVDSRAEEWLCDLCQCRSIDQQMERYQCVEGCDFDLCDACVGARVGPPESGVSALSAEDRRRFGLDAPEATGAAQ